MAAAVLLGLVIAVRNRPRHLLTLLGLIAAGALLGIAPAGMATQRAIDLRNQRLLQQRTGVLTTHERILDLRIEDAIRRLEKRPEGE